MAKSRIHRSAHGTYHPAPGSDPAWTINDTRGYIDQGPTCDVCGACHCDVQRAFDHETKTYGDCPNDHGEGCPGLTFAFVCLDGGETLCAYHVGDSVEIVECDCK